MVCPRCHGSGTCNECHGSGKSRCVSCEGGGKRFRANGQEIRCSHCEGTGLEACRPECESCRGSGEITMDQQRDQIAKYALRPVQPLQGSTRVTMILAGLIVANYALMGILYGPLTLLKPTSQALGDMGAMIPALFRAGDWWRILTSGLVHIGVLHFAFNLLALQQAGQILERQVGGARFVVVFVLSVAGGGVGDLLFQTPYAHCAGASGGLFGLIGFGLIYAWLLPDTEQRGFFFRWTLLGVVFSVAVGADHSGHGGGFITGAFLGLLAGRAVPATVAARALGQRAWQAAAVTCVLVFATAYGCMLAGLAKRGDGQEGVRLAKAGQMRQALPYLDRALKRRPMDFESLFYRSLVFQECGEYEKAIDDCTALLQLAPNEPSIVFLRVWSSIFAGRMEQAGADARRYIDLAGWQDEHARYAALCAYFCDLELGRKKEAEAMLRDALERPEADVWPRPVLLYLAGKLDEKALFKLATDTGKMTEARAYVGLALDIAGQDAAARAQYAWVRDRGDRTFVEHGLVLARLRKKNPSGKDL